MYVTAEKPAWGCGGNVGSDMRKSSRLMKGSSGNPGSGRRPYDEKDGVIRCNAKVLRVSMVRNVFIIAPFV
jgi:hypothetical protein